MLGSTAVSSGFYLLAADPDERWTWVEAVVSWPWHHALVAGWVFAACAAWGCLHHAAPNPFPALVSRWGRRGWWLLQVPAVLLAATMALQDGCWMISANALSAAAVVWMVTGALRLEGRKPGHPVANLGARTRQITPSHAVQQSEEGAVIGALVGLAALVVAISALALGSAYAIENRPGAPDPTVPSSTAGSPTTTAPPATTSPTVPSTTVVVEADPAVPVAGHANLTG